jgi:hypothetical protein
MHNGHWFDKYNPDDIADLKRWQSSSRMSYSSGINTWTVSDVKKRQCAKEHDLNYVVFWNLNLSDAKEWIKEGCPIRKDWK